MGVSYAILATIIVMALLNYIPLLQIHNAKSDQTLPLYAKGQALPD